MLKLGLNGVLYRPTR